MAKKKNSSPKPSPIEYACMWFNTKDRKTRAYDKNGKWVTKKETDDPFLIGLLKVADVVSIYDKHLHIKKLR